MSTMSETKPNGPVAAAFAAAGTGSLALGVLVVLSEASADIKSGLDFAKNYGLGSGVGPLSGKVIVAVAVFVISWVVFHLVLRGREVDFNRWFTASLVLVALGFALTFPPVFLLFEPKG